MVKFVDERIRNELRELATERCKVHSTGLDRDKLGGGQVLFGRPVT